jgi:hypothetical protein
MADDNQKKTSLDSAWTDNLLVRDKTGKLRRFQSDVPAIKDNSLSNYTSQISPKQIMQTLSFHTAPADDNFSAPLYPEGLAGDKSKLIFHPDDEKQLQDISAGLPADESKKYSIEKIAEKIITKHGLKFDLANKTKFTDILYDFFRERKSAIVVREALYLKVLEDSKPLTEETVNHILSIAKGLKSKIFSSGGLVVKQVELEKINQVKEAKESFKFKPEPIQAETKIKSFPLDSKPSLPSSLETKIISAPDPKEIDKEEPIIIKPLEKPEITIVKSSEPKEEVIKTIKPKIKLGEVPTTQIRVKEEMDSLPKVSRPDWSLPGKKTMSDVFIKPSQSGGIEIKPEVHHFLSGPVQELQDITLDNFRYLGITAEESVAKVLEKINVLEKDSFTKKAQGIEAWRNSEVYQLYLTLGQESMLQNKDIASLIAEYGAQSKPVLKLEEFSAISDLNKKLRF